MKIIALRNVDTGTSKRKNKYEGDFEQDHQK